MAEPERFLAVRGPAVLRRRARYVPREVLVPAEIPDRELLEAWLTRAARDARCASACPSAGEKVRLLELVLRNAQLAFDLEWRHPRKQSQEILRGLRDLLDLEVEPRRIECFDISNIQGSDIVASMVVFEDGLPKKSDYRKFRIRGLRPARRTTSRPCARSWAGATGGCWRRARSCPTSS